MPSTSPMPSKNLAAGENPRQVYRNSDANRLPPIDGQRRLDAALAGPGTWVVVLRTRREVRAFLEATGAFFTNRVALPYPITQRIAGLSPKRQRDQDCPSAAMQKGEHHDFTMHDRVYQSDPAAQPDSNFLTGELAMAVAGNRGRLRDARRTPLSLTAVDPARCEIEVRIDAFEDRGARWRLPAWEINRLQLELESERASPAATAELRRAVERFNRPLLVEADATATTRTRRRVEEQRALVRAELESVDMQIDLAANVQRREGEPRLYTALGRCLAVQQLTELDRRFCEAMVSNPHSGELVKGHAIVLAELGLCRFEGTIVRDPELFDEPWSRSRRAEHLIARLAFAQELWASGIGQPLTVYRAAAADGPLRPRQPASFVSCTFSEQVADEHFAGGPTTRSAVKWREAVDAERLLMTFLETAAFNERFKEAEAVLVGDPSSLTF